MDGDPSHPLLNPEPIAHLVGQSNEVSIIIDGQKVITYHGLQCGHYAGHTYHDLCKKVPVMVGSKLLTGQWE